VSWSRKFNEPIKLSNGKKLVTLRDAIAWLAKSVPTLEHKLQEAQTAAHCLTEAAENNGPMVFARIATGAQIRAAGPDLFRKAWWPSARSANSAKTCLWGV
jgi:hypothetical protein